MKFNFFKTKLIYSPSLGVFLFSLMMLSSCGLKVTSGNSEVSSSNIIAGIISPFLGSIADNSHSSFLISSATATSCADPVYAKLYKLQDDGTLLDSSPLDSVLVGADARYSFDLDSLKLSNINSKIEFIVKAEGCNGDVFKRPITSFDKSQNVDAKTTVITEVVNSVTVKKLNEADRKEVETLINSMSGSTTGAALTSLMNQANSAARFSQIFGSSPAVIQDAKPQVNFIAPTTTINELAVTSFSVSAFQVDPNYSFSYKWKLDGVVKSSSATWNYIPSANESGNHQVDLYVGQNDGSGNIDLMKPFYVKTIAINVNNNILPSAPIASISSSTPSPRTSNSISVDLNTGISFVNCASFSHIAVTETATPPGIMQFNIDCTTAGTQAETIIYSLGDGAKNLYFWAIDNEGEISSARTASFVLDTLAPNAGVSLASADLKGGSTQAITISASDTGTGLSTLNLYFSNNGGSSYSLISQLANNTSVYSWTVPLVNTSAGIMKLVATDIAGLSKTVYSNSFSIDSIAPTAPTITRTSAAFSNSTTVTMTVGSCTDISSILVTEINSPPSAVASGWQPCSTVVSAITATVTGEGTHTLYAWAKDLAGNIATSANSTSVILDTTAPVIAVTSPEALRGNVNTGTVNWTLTEENPNAGDNFLIELFNGSSWISIGTKSVNAGYNNGEAYSLSNLAIPNINTSTAKFRVSFTDSAGNATSTPTNIFPIGSLKPIIGTLQISNGSSTTTSSYVPVSLTATSQHIKMTHFCLKSNSTTPELSNNCWVPLNSPQPNVTPSLNINFSNYNYLLSFTPGPYEVYGWVKDLVGNISDYSSASIIVQTSIPPAVSKILVTNISNPTDPVAAVEKVFNGSQPAYIKWKTTSTSAATITLSYQTNSGTTTIASGLANGSNSGCIVNDLTTADDEATGCYVWNFPPAQYFNVIVKATDTDSISSQSLSYPLNASIINYLAGKVGLGLGTSALSAILKISGSWTDVGSLVVTTDGRIFLRDRTLGLVMVDPKDGVLQPVMPVTGTASGDGGPVTSATLCGAQKIALDFQDRILIFDCTKIRRINTAVSPMTIETIIGGGALQNNATDALSFKINGPSTSDTNTATKTIPFFALPNGDIYFSAGAYGLSVNAGNIVRKYQASNAKIYSIAPSGIGHSEDANVDIATKNSSNGVTFGLVYNTINSEITKMLYKVTQNYTGDNGGAYLNLDPITFVSTAPHPLKSGMTDYFIQGMDGVLYIHDARAGKFRRFNESTGLFTTLVGGGSDTICLDGALATSCKVNNGFSGFDAFVSATGQIYFIDYVGVVRTVLSDGTVRRIMGQSKGAGDGQLATEARANSIYWVDQANDGTIFFSDTVEDRIRKFTIDGNIYSHAAYSSSYFFLNKVTKDIYSRSGSNASKLAFAAPTWSNIGTLSKTYNGDANGPSEVIGYDENSTLLFTMQPGWTSALGYRNFRLGSFNWNPAAVTVLTDYAGGVGSYCANGTLASACSVASSGNARAQYDSIPVTPRWLMLKAGTNRVVTLNKDGLNNNEVLYTVATLPKNANSFVYRKVGGTELIDYCATDGSLNSYNITTSTNSLYSWPIASLTCDGRTMNYNSSRDSLIFPARQNGLSTIIEYKLNP